MIVGDYYINNYFLAFLGLVALGGLAVTAGVPGMLSPENPAGEKDYNLSIQGQGLNPGETAAIRMLKRGGDPVKNAEVFVNGRKTGQTNENGLATFQVPQAGNLTVSASKSGTNVTRTYRIESRSQDDGGEGEETPDEDEGNQEDEQNDQQDDQGSEDRDEQDQKQDDSQTDENETEKETGDNETVLDPYITKLRPSRDLEDPRFEPKFEIQASDASYNLSFNGKLEATGSINGTKNISMPFRMPKNGTIGLEVQLYRGKQSLAYRNFTFNYTAEQDEEKTVSDPAEVEAMFTAPSTAFTGEEILLNASESSGDIINYTWSIGGQAETTTTNHIHEHTFASTGEYRINLTVNGENGTSDNDSILIEVIEPEEPVIDFQQPLEGYETDQTSIQYEFKVENAASGAQYSILIDQSEKTSGDLEEGNQTVQRTVEIPGTVFNTTIQVQQNGEVYNSETRTVNPVSSLPEPDLFLRKPEEGSEYSSSEIEYNFTVYNGVRGSDYRIIADGESVKTGQLSNDGTATLSPLVSVPEGEFTTNVEIDQGGQTYTSESVSLISGQTTSEVSVALDHPDDGETVSETFDDTIDVSLNYTVDNRGWAQEATVTLENYEGSEIGSRTQTVSSGRSYSYTFEDIRTYKQDSKAEYQWKVELTGDGKTEKFGPRTFLAKKLRHIDVAELHSAERNESYSGVFNYSAMSNSMNGRILEITRNDTIITQKSQFDSFDINNRVEEFWIYEKGQHNVQVILRDVSTDEIVAQSRILQFKTTELPPDAGGGGGT